MIYDERERQRQRIVAHRHRTHPQHKPYGIEVVCAYCGRTKIRGEFMYYPAPTYKEKISHGICKSCMEKQINDINKIKIERGTK